MSNVNFTDYPDWDNPITNLLEGGDVNILTDAAKKLVEGDLLALSWKNHTKRTETLTVRDINSIEEAFSNHSLHGSSSSPAVGAACCCCCAPCCCTAVAVVKSA